MADPFSIIAGVVSICAGALQASTAVLDLIRSIKDAPCEIIIILAGLNNFSDLVSNLDTALQDPFIQNVVHNDTGFLCAVGSVSPPLATCCTVMTQLKSKIEKNLKAVKANGQQRNISATWYWKKSDVVGCMHRLQSNKLILNIALSSIVSYCTMRSFANSRTATQFHVRPKSIDTIAASAIQKYANSIARKSSSLESREEFFAPDKAEQCVKRAANQRDELLRAARIDDDMIVNMLIEQDADVNVRDHDDMTMLHIAAKYGSHAVATILLTQGADPNIKAGENGTQNKYRLDAGRTPLHWAAAEGHENTVQLLISHGAHMNARSHVERSPLQEAIIITEG